MRAIDAKRRAFRLCVGTVGPRGGGAAPSHRERRAAMWRPGGVEPLRADHGRARSGEPAGGEQALRGVFILHLVSFDNI